jgi:serine/threonine protein kinase
MKPGDEIKGYRITTAPTSSGGGMSVWAFASRGSRAYFIKEFLSPKWPLPESMGSEASKVARRAECFEFERRHREVMKRLLDAAPAPGGGNLVTAIEFFRSGTTYYKVTDRVVTASLTSLVDLSVRERAVIFRTLVLGLRMLHRKDIVHGDLKPANVLIQRVPQSSLHTAKLIDFDDSYLTGKPPTPDQIVGDSIYAAPEWFGYTMNDDLVTSAMLTKAADIFSLGLVFHHYLTGELPAYDRERFSAPGLAVYARQPVVPDPRLNYRLISLLVSMTAANPADRPAIDQVFNELKHDSLLAIDAPAPTRATADSGRVVSSIASRTTSATYSSEGTGRGVISPADATARGSRVRINLPKSQDIKER